MGNAASALLFYFVELFSDPSFRLSSSLDFFREVYIYLLDSQVLATALLDEGLNVMYSFRSCQATAFASTRIQKVHRTAYRIVVQHPTALASSMMS